MVSLQDRYLGCLLGGALGDALGAPVEFLSTRDIDALVGPDGVRHFLPTEYGPELGLVTDDTQMSVFTVDGLVRALSHSVVDPAGIRRYVHDAYLRWLRTQDSPSPSSAGGWVDRQEWLYAQRAPGLTCLSALRGFDGSLGHPAVNNSKGCGAVMRAAPFGLLNREDGPELAADCAALTHGHVSGQVPAGALASMIACLVKGAEVAEAVEAGIAWSATADPGGPTQVLLHRAVAAATGSGRLEELGAGWVGEEALAIAVFAALSHPDRVLKALALSVSHSGDSDSTGSLCGNLLGAAHGAEALPSHLLEQLEGSADIERLAQDLYTVVHDPRQLSSAYPPV